MGPHAHLHPRLGGRSSSISGGCSPLPGPLNRRPRQGDFSMEFHKEAHDEGSWKPQLCER